MSSFFETAKQLTPEVYENFKRAIETGKWPDGRALSDKQKTLVMEAVIVYEKAMLPAEQQTGYMPDGCQSKQEKSSSDGGVTDKIRFDPFPEK